MRRAALLAALAAAAFLPASAHAVTFRHCSLAEHAECATVTVPIDRSGAVPGTIAVHFVRVRAAHPTRAPLVLITGGPGQSGTDMIADTTGPFPPDQLDRDIIAFDPRGTGRSGLLRCPALEKAIAGSATDAAATACWNSLGAARYDYTSRSVADDIDAIRQAIGAPKIALYGISYGTSEAQTYARVYPQFVDRVILDSALPPGGGDGLERQSFGAVARVLREVCISGRCGAVTRDPLADLATLISRLPDTGIVGHAISERGKRVRERAGRYELFDLLVNGDFDPTLRGSFPGAVASALRGDDAPLLRLVRASLADDTSDFNDPRLLSTADFAATDCEEGVFPWARGAALSTREAAVAAVAQATPAASIYPFDAKSLLSPDIVEPCLSWPQSPVAPDLGSANPNVPVLVLSGEADLRTPLEGAKAVAAGFPASILRSYPYQGHDVVDSSIGEACAWRQAREFLDAASVGECNEREYAPSIAPIAPTSLGRVSPQKPGGRAGRLLHAVGLTLDDAFLSPGDTVVPGLRAGRAVFGTDVRYAGYSYVPGVKVSGSLKPSHKTLNGTLRVTGGGGGRLVLERNRITGVLDGHSIHARLHVGIDHITAVSARAAREQALHRVLRFPRPR